MHISTFHIPSAVHTSTDIQKQRYCTDVDVDMQIRVWIHADRCRYGYAERRRSRSLTGSFPLPQKYPDPCMS